METKVEKVNVEPVSGVMATKVRKTASNKGSVYQVELRQKTLRPVTNISGLLNISMAGHESFGTLERTRVCWQNFSEQQLQTLGLPATLSQIDDAGRDGISFMENPVTINWVINGKSLELKIVEIDSFEGRTWIDGQGVQQRQQAKRAGQDGEVLTQGGRPIFRNTYLAAKGAGADMDFSDTIIPHDNVIVGSTLANRAPATANASNTPATQGPGALGEAVIAGSADAAKEDAANKGNAAKQNQNKQNQTVKQP